MYERSGSPLVLVVDADPCSSRVLCVILEDNGFRPMSAQDAVTGLSVAEQFQPHAILIALGDSHDRAFDACRELKSTLSTAEIPVIFITSGEPNDAVFSRCYELGANDLMTQPVNPVHLLARIRVALRERLLRENYRKLAIEDPYTGLANRRQSFLYITEGIVTARRRSQDNILAIADLDGLSAINHAYGYDFGDEVVLTFSRIIRRLGSKTCRLGRVGGDEFIMVMINVPRGRALTTAQRVSRTFSSISFDAQTAQPKHFSASFGLACYDGSPTEFDPDRFLCEADMAMRHAKSLSRGRVTAHWQLSSEDIRKVDDAKRHARTTGRVRTQRAYIAAPGGEEDSPASVSQEDSM